MPVGVYPRTHRPPADRLWAKVERTDGCWNWAGRTDGGGYGLMWIGGRGGRWVRTHRLSWELHFGPIPGGLYILHRCDNPRCVRPDHLFTGTIRDNTLDMFAKGRANTVWGERHPSTHLSNTDVLGIRRAVAGGEQQTAVARRYGITKLVVSRIVRRVTWRRLF